MGRRAHIKDPDHVLIVGAGIFGLSGALELAERGHRVTVIDRGPLPHPKAASNDISRMVRMDYGADRLYTRLAAEAIDGWHRWNSRWGRDMYHEDGLLLLSSRPLEENSYEGDSYRTVSQEGRPLQRLSRADIASRFSGWNSDHYMNGYFNPRGGWAEAGEVIALLAREVQSQGVAVHHGSVSALTRQGERVTGVALDDGGTLEADHVVVASGVWTPTLLPELDGFLRLSGQPVLYFQPADPRPFGARQFPPWGADLAISGWYGFPADRDGIVKVGHHGPGYTVGPDADRVIPGQDDEHRCREFLSHSLPALADAPLARSKMCVYTDTWDGNFLTSRHPDLEGLTVATGGSGHGFKFGPALGRLISDAVEGTANPYRDRFAWRSVGEMATEDARYTG